MKITIDHNEGQWTIDTANPPERSLDELLDTFATVQVRSIINQTLETFGGICYVWNQRELAQRRELGLGREG